MAADMSTQEVAVVTSSLPPIREMGPFFFWISHHSAIYSEIAKNLNPDACECARQALYDMEVTTARGLHPVRPS
jgi:hypothetical protein